MEKVDSRQMAIHTDRVHDLSPTVRQCQCQCVAVAKHERGQFTKVLVVSIALGLHLPVSGLPHALL
jgi:hypothetical protein